MFFTVMSIIVKGHKVLLTSLTQVVWQDA